jgi:signal transduction histidine kinase
MVKEFVPGALEGIQKELEQLVYSVTHDLRAPVRHIEGYSSLVLEEGPLSDQQKHLLNRVISSADRLGRLIDELLEFSRTRIMNPVMESLDLATIVQEVIQNHSPTRIVWKVDDLPGIQGDRKLIRRVWENLLENAVKFSREKAAPCVEIRAEERPFDWLFTVSDNGSGFDMRFSAKLFEVFQRLHPQDEFPGTGIGLAIVKRILLQHGGKIWAIGVVNKGASFYFTIPK